MLEPIQPIQPEGGGQPTVSLKPPERPPEGTVRADRRRIASTRLSFSQSETGDIIVRVFHRGTGELIRQIPPEERLKLAARIRMILEHLEA